MEEINIDNYNSWFSSLGNIWINRKPELLKDILAKDVKYFEDPFKKSLNLNQTIREWEIVPKNQRNIKFKFKILVITKNYAIASWEASYEKIENNKQVKLKGIFQVTLNKKGKCTEFHQWYNMKI
jgi:hypothetical protein